MKTLIAVLCFAILATSVRGQDQESRLLTAIRKPQITTVALNTTVSNLGNITVAFKTGPNFPGTTFSVKCVPGTQGCNGPAAGDGEVSSYLPLKPSYVEAEITNVPLGNNNTYQCFVTATIGKFSKCIEAAPPSGTVTAFVRYLSYTPATFGAAEKAQLCKNFLALAPGTCDVVAVRPGSAVPEAVLQYESIFTAAEVFSELNSPTNATLNILGTGLGTGSNIGGIQATLSSGSLPEPIGYSPGPAVRRSRRSSFLRL